MYGRASYSYIGVAEGSTGVVKNYTLLQSTRTSDSVYMLRKTPRRAT